MAYSTGDVIFLTKVNIPKRSTKHGVVVCPVGKWFFYINTELRGIFKGPRISHHKYPFLNGKDRYIACNFRQTYGTHSGSINKVANKAKDSLDISDLKSLQDSISIISELDSYSIETIMSNIDNRIKELSSQEQIH